MQCFRKVNEFPRGRPSVFPINNFNHISTAIHNYIVMTKIIVDKRKRTKIADGYGCRKFFDSERDNENRGFDLVTIVSTRCSESIHVAKSRCSPRLPFADRVLYDLRISFLDFLVLKKSVMAFFVACPDNARLLRGVDGRWRGMHG